VLELRTKSTQVRSLLNRPVSNNCVVAFSFTPEEISSALEHKVPSNQKRLDALRKLQNKGWKIGLRFDPMIYDDNYEEQYAELFEKIFSQLDPEKIHSVSLGVFRLPDSFYRNMQRLYPEEKLFAVKLIRENGMVSYESSLEKKMLTTCEELLMKYITDDIYFPCKL
jgi:spore photoproduct lyase